MRTERGILLHPEVHAALTDRRPVVALETAVVTHGLPRTPLTSAAVPHGLSWDDGAPANLAAMHALEEIVRLHGAVPATVAVIDGTLRIGLDSADLERLAVDEGAMKCAARDLAFAGTFGRNAGTTVSATLLACRLAGPPHGPEPIRVFATGGIGGAHPGWAQSGDISADLAAIAQTQACVVSAGAKSILDLAATVEMLDTLGVPVIGFRTDRFPRFHSVGDDRVGVPHRLDSIDEVAELCRLHWTGLAGGGVLLAVPVPSDDAVETAEVERAIRDAERRAEAENVYGAALTPFLLHAMAEASGGRLLRANLALLAENARVAAMLSGRLGAAADSPI